MTDAAQTTPDQERLTAAYRDQRNQAIGQLAQAMVEIDRLRAALAVYANPDAWYAGNDEKAYCDNIFLVDNDGWILAAEALK